MNHDERPAEDNVPDHETAYEPPTVDSLGTVPEAHTISIGPKN